MVRIAKSVTPLSYIANLKLNTLDELEKQRKRLGGLKRYRKIEADIKGQEKARDLPTYLLYRYQFDEASIKEIANELGVSTYTLSRLRKSLNIPQITIRERKRGEHFSDETREKMSQAHMGKHFEEYNDTEKEIIQSFLENLDLDERVPQGTYQRIHDEILREIGNDRNIRAIQVYVNNVIKYPENKTRINNRSKIKRELTEIINEDLDELTKDNDAESLVDPFSNEPARENRKRREEWLKYTTPGHQKLLIFLSDPENYQKYIEGGIKLVRSDFRIQKNDCPESRRLYEIFHEKIRSLEECSEDESKLVDFVDGWMRCDLVYRRNNGEFIVVEIKQYAMNRGKNRNADKTLEQTQGYTAAFSARIRRFNRKNKDKKGFVRIPKFVDGYVAAYEIEPGLREDLRESGLYFSEVSKEEVEEYIEERLDKRVEKMIVEKKKEEIQTPQKTGLEYESNQVQSKNGNARQEPAEIQRRTSAIGINQLPKDKFRNIYYSIDHSPRGSMIGIYDPQRRLLQVYGKRYSLNGSKKRVGKIMALVSKGKLVEGHLNY